jgi:hypothetical protein
MALFRKIFGCQPFLLGLRFVCIPWAQPISIFFQFTVESVNDANFSIHKAVCYRHLALLLTAIYFLACHLQWENIDKIKEFNWNFENLEV